MMFDVLAIIAVGASFRSVESFSPSPNPSQPSIFFTSLPAVAMSDGTKSEPPLREPPGRPTPRFGSFLFDDTLKLLNPTTMGSYQVERKNQFGSVFKTNIFFQPTVFCTDESSLSDLALEESRKSLSAFFPPHHQKLFGTQSIIVQSGETHKRIRRLIQPALSPLVLSSFNNTIDASVQRFLDNLKQEHQNDFAAMVPKLRSFFVSLTLTVVLGSSSESAAILTKDIEIWCKGLLAAPLTFVPWSTAAKAMRARKRIVDELNKLMQGKLENGLLKKLMAARDEDTKSALSSEDIIDNVLTLVFAGSDTTASAATSLWILLATNPQIKADLQDCDSDESLHAVVDWVLKKYPPAPFSMRQNGRDDLVISNYHIPAKYLVVYGLAGAMSEFSSYSAASLNSILSLQGVNESKSKAAEAVTASSAFGVGPRKCPGRFLASMELVVFLKNLLKMDWQLDPEQNIEQKYTPGFFPVDGLKIKFV